MGTLQQHFLLGQLPANEDIRHSDTHESAPQRLRDLHVEFFPGVDGMLELERYARPPRYYVGKRLDEVLGKGWERLLGKPRQFVTLLVTDAVQGSSYELDYKHAQRLFDLTDQAALEIERTGRLPEVIESYLDLLEKYESEKRAGTDGSMTTRDSGLVVPGSGCNSLVIPDGGGGFVTEA